MDFRVTTYDNLDRIVAPQKTETFECSLDGIDADSFFANQNQFRRSCGGLRINF